MASFSSVVDTRLKTWGPIRCEAEALMAGRDVNEWTALALRALADALDDRRTPPSALSALTEQVAHLSHDVAQTRRRQ